MREAAEAVIEQRREVGERIREARKARGWKQKDLAAAVHVEPLTVSRWERGQHMPDLDTLGLVAEATRRSFSFFLSVPDAAQDGDSAILEKLDEVLGRLDRLEAAVAGGPPAAQSS